MAFNEINVLLNSFVCLQMCVFVLNFITKAFRHLTFDITEMYTTSVIFLSQTGRTIRRIHVTVPNYMITWDAAAAVM